MRTAFEISFAAGGKADIGILLQRKVEKENTSSFCCAAVKRACVASLSRAIVSLKASTSLFSGSGRSSWESGWVVIFRNTCGKKKGEEIELEKLTAGIWTNDGDETARRVLFKGRNGDSCTGESALTALSIMESANAHAGNTVMKHSNGQNILRTFWREKNYGSKHN